ncbi:hypothetical protein ACPTKS_30665 [Pseudomonas aeruginosa]|jgi:hypothetical protein|uniref:hypothetical protein n=1 Tax=Pseudomonas aeruginosa TaxID=287 RepID=UPI003CC673C8
MKTHHFVVAVFMMTTYPFLDAMIQGKERPSDTALVLMGIGFVLACIVYFLNLINARKRINYEGMRATEPDQLSPMQNFLVWVIVLVTVAIVGTVSFYIVR